MATNYIVQSQKRGVQVLSDTVVVDVEEVGANTVPHGVYFEREIPITTWTQDHGAAMLDELATGIEQRLDSGLADSAQWTQDLGTDGLLSDFVDFTVSIPPGPGQLGPMTTVVRVPVNLLTSDTAIVGDLVTPLFEDAIANLHATAGL
jgi:hypothetical protein